MVLNSPKEDRSTVVCAPCGNGSPALNYIHNDDKTKQFYLAKGKITVKLNVTEEFRYLKLISPTKDIMPMESKEETMDSVKWKNMGVRIKMEAQIRFDTVIQEINFSYELVRTNEEGKLCADGSADIFFSIANGFKSIDIKCFIHDVTLMPVFTIPQFVNYLQYIFVNCSDDTDPSSTCMVFMFGGFLSACVRTYIVRTYQDHGLFLCSAFYNIYDEDSGIIDFVFADVLWTALEFEGDYYSARLQMIETIDSATNKTIHKMVIGLPCFPNTSPICDAGLPHSRPDTDVPEIPKRSCIKGVVDGKRIIADGLVGYCKYEGGDDFSINDTSYPGEACFQITENLKAYCKPNFEKGKCECCCVNDEKECNAEFTENNLYYSLYLTCQESLRHGEHEPFYTNIKVI
ncbi:unnamed protein product [Bursaphelenchus okinawaensis]|uniref:Uncharacterized protein n=1 Tax=Bursaphelenchus okinawaensis TaxID=465554 RepID=A0A811KD82_9BILA|nr:unnamed protein product [Bursaphelenchus okinawaensis]CAG9101403.1 unnamed protein product [Bursaphelenchus okinawaensis]